jgi:hypothetical protein
VTGLIKWEFEYTLFAFQDELVDRLLSIKDKINLHAEINITVQGRIQDFKLGGGALKKIAPSRGRREHFWGISCEKSRFYAKKNHIFTNFRGARRVRPPPPPPPPPPPGVIQLPNSLSHSGPILQMKVDEMWHCN